MARHIKMEFRLRCWSLLGFFLRTDEFQGGAEEFFKRGVHFAAQAINLGQTSAGGGNKIFKKSPSCFFCARASLRSIAGLVFCDFGDMHSDMHHWAGLAKRECEDS